MMNGEHYTFMLCFFLTPCIYFTPNEIKHLNGFKENEIQPDCAS